jgi:glycosyltransferase involved in cell wall biosynthesis
MRITLFFTRGLSLQIWAEMGILDREVAIYQRLQQKGIQVGFVTYGDRSDYQYASRIPGIKILCNHWNLSPARYERWLHLLHAPWLWLSDVFKTNQTNGADIALRAAQFWRKPLVARCGYMWSDFVAKQEGIDSQSHDQAQSVESQVFNAAQRVIVTTPMMAADIAQRFPSAAAHTFIIPNYVETDRFRPIDDCEHQRDFELVFVGRIAEQKNVATLLEAIAPLNVRLLLIGDGELRKPLQKQFAHLGNRIQWQGNVANVDLPAYLHRARLFILPSYYEGHPKALIEAMSCGLPVIGADSPGIKEIISHGENGWLCNPDVDSIRMAIEQLLAQLQLQSYLGNHARQYVLKHYSLNKIVNVELALLKDMVAK